MQSIWEKETFYPAQDILIVGAGLMGLWTAWELKQLQPTLKITILERNPLPSGASTRNAGFACFGSPTELIRNSETMGMDAMLELVEQRFKGISKIKTMFAAEQIGFEDCGGYETINKDYRHWSTLEDHIHELNKTLKGITGHASVFVRDEAQRSVAGLGSFDAVYANPTEAALHSGKLVQSLTSKVKDAGVQIVYGFTVEQWDADAAQVTVRNGEQCFKAQQLAFCTNAFTPALVPAIPVEPARGQVILTSPIPNLPMKGTFHFDEGFYYWRHLGDRILLGGARNKALTEEHTTDQSGSVFIRQQLEIFLERLLPGYRYSIEAHWSGIMAFTEDGKPLLQRINERTIAAISCNGMGVALTPMIAEKLAGMLVR
jgi:gamma-glutamylputrescine oxidase